MLGFSLGLYEKSMPNHLTLEEKLICAKKAGFDFLEISIDESNEKLARLDSSKKERQELVRLMFELDIPIRTMCLSGHRKYPLGSLDEKIREKSLEIMGKAIQLAANLGIRIIQLAGYDVYYEESSEETKAMFAENLLKAVEMAAKQGIVLGFETMETEFMNTVTKSMKYVKLINSPYLKIYPDIGNLTNAALTYNTNVLEDIKAGEGNIVACHVKETVPGIFREVPFGEGHVDFEACIGQMLKQGVRIFVSEFWYVGNKNWEEELTKAREFFYQNLTSS